MGMHYHHMPGPDNGGTVLHKVQFRTIDAEPVELPPKRQRRSPQRTQAKLPSFDDMERDLF